MITCPKCGRFVRQTSYVTNGKGEILYVKAMCAKCGKVHANWETYEEVVGYE